MAILKESVDKLGILVPVTVYQAPSRTRGGSARFILLDGERRWRCAIELGVASVPAIVVEKPDDTRNILTMFHIHNVREGWQLMPTALKLQTLIEELTETNERKLAELTKLSISQIRRCKILLSYPRRFQNLMLAPPSERMKADFFIELDRVRRPARDDSFRPWRDFGDIAAIQVLMHKYQSGVIKNVTDFRALAALYRASRTASQRRILRSEFGRILKIPEVGIEDLVVPGATFAKEAKEVSRSAKRLHSQIANLDPSAFASDEDAVSALKSLVRVIKQKLQEGLLLGVRDEA